MRVYNGPTNCENPISDFFSIQTNPFQCNTPQVFSPGTDPYRTVLYMVGPGKLWNYAGQVASWSAHGEGGWQPLRRLAGAALPSRDCKPTSFWLAWLFNSDRGSLRIPCLFHTTANISYATLINIKEEATIRLVSCMMVLLVIFVFRPTKKNSHNSSA